MKNLFTLLLVVFLASGCALKMFTPSKEEPSDTTVQTLDTTHQAGDIQTISADGVNFNMVYVPGGLQFPSGINDNETANVPAPYWLAETEVTYKVWYKVRTWAEDPARGANKYTFAQKGCEGADYSNSAQPPSQNSSQNRPVVWVSWRDAMVFTNALTEWYNEKTGSNLIPVYCLADGVTPIRISTKEYTTIDPPWTPVNPPDHLNAPLGSDDNPFVRADADGFRLPLNMEWELAARYIGTTAPTVPPLVTERITTVDTVSGITYYWTPGNYVSGAENKLFDLTPQTITGVSIPNYLGIYSKNFAWSKLDLPISTRPVKLRLPNALGLYDMSGNVWEYVFEWQHPTNMITRNTSGPVVSTCYYMYNNPSIPTFKRRHRGGDYGILETLAIGDNRVCDSDNQYVNDDIGFRLARSVIVPVIPPPTSCSCEEVAGMFTSMISGSCNICSLVQFEQLMDNNCCETCAENRAFLGSIGANFDAYKNLLYGCGSMPKFCGEGFQNFKAQFSSQIAGCMSGSTQAEIDAMMQKIFNRACVNTEICSSGTGTGPDDPPPPPPAGLCPPEELIGIFNDFNPGSTCDYCAIARFEQLFSCENCLNNEAVLRNIISNFERYRNYLAYCGMSKFCEEGFAKFKIHFFDKLRPCMDGMSESQVDALLNSLFNRMCRSTSFCGSSCDETLTRKANQLVSAINGPPSLSTCQFLETLSKLNSIVNDGICGCSETDRLNLNEAARFVREKIFSNMRLSQEVFQDKYCSEYKADSMRKFLTSLAVSDDFCGVELSGINGLSPEFMQNFLCNGLLCVDDATRRTQR